MVNKGKKWRKGKYKNVNISRLKMAFSVKYKVFFINFKVLSLDKIYKNKGHKL